MHGVRAIREPMDPVRGIDRAVLETETRRLYGTEREADPARRRR
jgi:hypothetical protein